MDGLQARTISVQVYGHELWKMIQEDQAKIDMELVKND
jgi:hypothetical protein